MNLKIILWGAAILSLTACGNSEQPNELEQTSQPEETVIELEDNDRVYDEGKFNKNGRLYNQVSHLK